MGDHPEKKKSLMVVVHNSKTPTKFPAAIHDCRGVKISPSLRAPINAARPQVLKCFEAMSKVMPCHAYWAIVRTRRCRQMRINMTLVTIVSNKLILLVLSYLGKNKSETYSCHNVNRQRTELLPPPLEWLPLRYRAGSTWSDLRMANLGVHAPLYAFMRCVHKNNCSRVGWGTFKWLKYIFQCWQRNRCKC